MANSRRDIRVALLARLELSGGVDTNLGGVVGLDECDTGSHGSVLVKVVDLSAGGVIVGEEGPAAAERLAPVTVTTYKSNALEEGRARVVIHQGERGRGLASGDV